MSNLCVIIKIARDYDNIEESLTSLGTLPSAYVICHNGRVSKTVNLIKDFFDKLSIPGVANYCNLDNQRAVFKFGKYWDYFMIWNIEDKLIGTPDFTNLELERYNLIDQNKKSNLCIYKSDTTSKLQPTTGTIKGDYYLEKCGARFKKFDGYIFHSNKDSDGGDIQECKNNTLEELKKLADKDPKCLGFNTRGWLKYRIRNNLNNMYANNEFTNGIYIKNINPDIQAKINVIINSKKQTGLSFIITSCKRYDLFKETIDIFLLRCQDVESIQEWICIDDNSSDEDRTKMAKNYPFFKFIWKTPEDKGHQKSLNILLDQVTTPYVLNFEDDWFCRENFTIMPLLEYLKASPYSQLILRKISKTPSQIVTKINTNPIYDYVYSPDSVYKPNENKLFDAENNHKQEAYKEIKNWWWPGFSSKSCADSLASI